MNGPRPSPSSSSGSTPVTRATSAGRRGSVTASSPAFEFTRARRLTVDASQRPIARAQADAPICKPDLIQTRAELGKSGWHARALPAGPGVERV